MVMNCRGTLDVENRQMMMDVVMNTEILGEADAEWRWETFLLDDMIYTGLNIPEVVPIWVKSEIPEGYWENANQVKAQLEFVKTSQVELIGSEEVTGVDCYLLQLTPDMWQLWQMVTQQAKITGEAVPEVDQELIKDTFRSFSVKQWIAKDTYFLMKTEEVMFLELTPEAIGFPGEEGIVNSDITISLLAYNYNQPVSIVLPPEAEGAIGPPEQ